MITKQKADRKMMARKCHTHDMCRFRIVAMTSWYKIMLAKQNGQSLPRDQRCSVCILCYHSFFCIKEAYVLRHKSNHLTVVITIIIVITTTTATTNTAAATTSTTTTSILPQLLIAHSILRTFSKQCQLLRTVFVKSIDIS